MPRSDADSRTLGVSAMPAAIVIMPYDPQWPTDYQRERTSILAALGGHALIEHIGSTSVPGLAAKPIIDIMAGMERFADAARLDAPLATIGYELRDDLTAKLGLQEDRLYFNGPTGSETVHLHVTQIGSTFWREKLLFRDLLRADAELAGRYAALKYRLAPQFSDGPSYSTAKGEFIRAALEQAQTAFSPAAPAGGSRTTPGRGGSASP